MNNNSANKSPETPAPFFTVEVILGEGGIGVSGCKKKSAPFMDTLGIDVLDERVDVGTPLPLNMPQNSNRVYLRFTKPEAVDVVVDVLQKIKSSFPQSPAEGTQGIPKGAECLVLWEGDKPCPATLPASADETEQTRRCRPEYRWVRMVEVQHGK